MASSLLSRRWLLLFACLVHGLVIGAASMSWPPLFGRVVLVDQWRLDALERGWAMIPLGAGMASAVTGACLLRRAGGPLLGGALVLAWVALLAIGLLSGAMSLFFALMLADPGTGGAHAAPSVAVTTTASSAGGFLIPFLAAPLAEHEPGMALLVFAGAFAVAGVALPTNPHTADPTHVPEPMENPP